MENRILSSDGFAVVCRGWKTGTSWTSSISYEQQLGTEIINQITNLFSVAFLLTMRNSCQAESFYRFQYWKPGSRKLPSRLSNGNKSVSLWMTAPSMGLGSLWGSLQVAGFPFHATQESLVCMELHVHNIIWEVNHPQHAARSPTSWNCYNQLSQFSLEYYCLYCNDVFSFALFYWLTANVKEIKYSYSIFHWKSYQIA